MDWMIPCGLSHIAPDYLHSYHYPRGESKRGLSAIDLEKPIERFNIQASD